MGGGVPHPGPHHTTQPAYQPPLDPAAQLILTDVVTLVAALVVIAFGLTIQEWWRTRQLRCICKHTRKQHDDSGRCKRCRCRAAIIR